MKPTDCVSSQWALLFCDARASICELVRFSWLDPVLTQESRAVKLVVSTNRLGIPCGYASGGVCIAARYLILWG